jgi:glycosyltransferase involved in cell wall biosynthesis
MNEKSSLSKTIDTIESENPTHIFEFIIILSPKSHYTVKKNAEEIALKVKNRKLIFVQETPLLGGAIRDGISRASGSYILLMASDLETNPKTIPKMILASEENPESIIIASRWLGDESSFGDYSTPKRVLNWIFQSLIRSMYKVSLTDFTFGFRLYPRATLENISWRTENFAFLLESLLRPLKQGACVKEVPTEWKARSEGKSSNSWSYFLTYFKVAIMVRIGAWET